MTPANTNCPTSNPEQNGVLHELVTSAQAVPGDNFIGAYLQGSFAVGDWDACRNVDWLIAMVIAERARVEENVLVRSKTCAPGRPSSRRSADRRQPR